MVRGARWLPFALALWVTPVARPEAGQQSIIKPPPTEAPRRTVLKTVVVGQIDAHVVERALEVLPRRPERIEFVDDADLVVPIAKRTAEMDAFVIHGSKIIFLRRQSPTVREAEFSGGPYVLMLALVIWHEMAHGEGLDEYEARRREEVLWSDFIRSGRIDVGFGMAYLSELQARK